jgi:large subunit ribosomal protein L22
MIEARATARYVRTSAQKAGLVLDLIRGRDVNVAVATLRFSRKSVARDIAKVLRSAIANAQMKEGFGGDPDRLYVSACYADQGPSAKRIRPAPMGRAFRVLKRTAHLTVKVAEQPLEIAAVGETPAAGARRVRPAEPPDAGAKAAATGTPAAKKAGPKKAGTKRAGARKAFAKKAGTNKAGARPAAGKAPAKSARQPRRTAEK